MKISIKSWEEKKNPLPEQYQIILMGVLITMERERMIPMKELKELKNIIV